MQKPKYTYFFDKQPAYEQLAIKWQIAEQLTELTPLSLRFSFIINIKLLLGERCTKSQLPRKHYWKNFDLWVDNYQFTTLQL